MPRDATGRKGAGASLCPEPHDSHPHATGIDIGDAEHWVAVPSDRAPQPVRRFGTCTADLDALASWLGLCPQHKISGGKVLSRRVRPGAHRVTVALRLAARSLHHSQRALGAFFRRMKARLGTPKAITATAHTLARLVESLRQPGSAYGHQGLEA